MKGDPDFPVLPPEIIQRLLRRPEDMVDNVGETLRRYKTNALRLLEDYMADHDQQFVIELDANLAPSELFQVSTICRLRKQKLSKTIMPSFLKFSLFSRV